MPPRVTTPGWVGWALGIAGVVALSISVVDFHRSIADNVSFRLRVGLVAVGLLVLARAASRRASRPRVDRRRGSR